MSTKRGGELNSKNIKLCFNFGCFWEKSTPPWSVQECSGGGGSGILELKGMNCYQICLLLFRDVNQNNRKHNFNFRYLKKKRPPPGGVQWGIFRFWLFLWRTHLLEVNVSKLQWSSVISSLKIKIDNIYKVHIPPFPPPWDTTLHKDLVQKKFRV